jgi:hypothetical protein
MGIPSHIRRLPWLVIVLAGGLALTGCLSGSSASSGPTAKSAAYAWFRTVNAKNLTAAQAHFAVADRNQMDWGEGDVADWPTFSDVNCKTSSSSTYYATVFCSFKESAAPLAGNPDTGWALAFQRQKSGPWLITGYGQG